jgi:hypothetical protein
MKIITPRQTIETTHHERSFKRLPPSPWCNGGFGFPCDAQGNVDMSTLPAPAQNNFVACLQGEVRGEPVKDMGVTTWTTTHREPAVGECDDCGAHVELHDFTNTCSCGADYNMSGQRLAPRSQWGAETGEHWMDCF